MDEPYLGEIRAVPYDFAPRRWALCDGSLLPISGNQALFSLIGTTYGGNGQTTFALPDLRSRVPVGQGQGPGLSNYTVGQTAGADSVALQQSGMPAHNHPFTGTLQTGGGADETAVTGKYPATGTLQQYSTSPKDATLGATVSGTTANQGGGQPHENRQPFIAQYYVIALDGSFPSRQ